MSGELGQAVLVGFAAIAVVSMIMAMGKAPNGSGMVALYFAAFSSVLTGVMQRLQNATLPIGIGAPVAVVITLMGLGGLIAAYFKLARDIHDVAGAWIGAVCVILMSQGTSLMW